MGWVLTERWTLSVRFRELARHVVMERGGPTERSLSAFSVPLL